MIYISYNEEDAASANYLNQILKERNFATWIAFDELIAGDDIDSAVWSRISNCSWFVFCLGRHGVSELQQRELSAALDADRKILPVLLPNTETDVRHVLLDTHVFIDFRRDFKDRQETVRLFRLLSGDVNARRRETLDSRDPGRRTSTRTARKAVNVAIVKDGRILVVQRAGTQKTGGELWQLPGGKILDGESNEDAAVREIKEEVGLDLDARQLVFVREFVDKWIIDANEDYFVMSLYIYFTTHAPLDVHGEFKSYKWLAIQQLFDDKGIIYFSSTTTYLQYIRRFLLTHLPLHQIASFIKDNFKNGTALPKRLTGISEESAAVMYSFLSLLGFLTDRGDFYPASTLSHQLINLLAEWALTDGVIFEAVETREHRPQIRRNDDALAVAKYREGLFDHHSNLLGILSAKLPKALSSRKVASLLVFGTSPLRDEKLMLVRWDFLAQKYQIPSRGLEDVETDVKDIETARTVVAQRFEARLVDEFDYEYFTKLEIQRLGAGSLGLVAGDGPMLRNYLISFFKLSPKPGSDATINRVIDAINQSTVEFIEVAAKSSREVAEDISRNLRFYMWVSVDRILSEPTRIVGEMFQGFSDLLERVEPDELTTNIRYVEVVPQEFTPITFTPDNGEFDHRVELREQYATRS